MKTTLLFFLILICICNMTVLPQVCFGFPQHPRPVVRLIYFLPNDREPAPGIDAKMDTLIKDVQQFYANQMAAHGFGRKTFQFETDAGGNAVVHRVRGRFTDKYYSNLSDTSDIWDAIEEQFDLSQSIYLTVIDISSEIIVRAGDEVCGVGSVFYDVVGEFLRLLVVRGRALIPASGPCFNLRIAAHELGHAFGLDHDFRNDSYVMSYGVGKDKLSQCAAEVLNVHPAFNLAQPVLDTGEPTSEMFPPSFAFAPNAIRLRFNVSDPDGLYQAQALVREDEFLELLGCKQLNGNARSTFEIITTYLVPTHKQTTIHLRVIDMQGNTFYSEPYPINIIDVLPPAEVVTIPDANLTAAVRETLKLDPGTALTTYMMLGLEYLEVTTGRIRDLTGLEHAYKLKELKLHNNQISDVSPLAGLTELRTLWLGNNGISDISPLAGLTQLQSLRLTNNRISDVSPLAGLTQLQSLRLTNNRISDVSPLAGLTQLTSLSLSGKQNTNVDPYIKSSDSNNIRDVSGLAGLTQLRFLDLELNNISDVSPLAGLTQLETLRLYWNNISDVSPLAGLTQLEILRLDNNNISDVSALAGLTQLTELNLGFNNIADVFPLANLTQLLLARESIGEYSFPKLNLVENPLSHASINMLHAKGYPIDKPDPALLKISGDVQEGAPGTVLTVPFTVEAIDENGKPMQGVSVTFTVTGGGGKLSRTTATTDVRGRAHTTLTLGEWAGRNTVHATAEGIQSRVIFNATGTVDYRSSEHIATLESGRSWGGVPIAFSPDGMILAAGAGRGKVKLWDVATRRNVATFGSGPNLIEDVAFSPDGVLLAVSNNAGGVELWDVDTHTNFVNFKTTFETRTWFTSGVAFSPDGALLAVGLEDGVELWDVATRTKVADFESGVTTPDVAFSPDGLLLASGGFDSTVALWDIATRTKVATFLHQEGWISSVAFSPDGLLLASSETNSGYLGIIGVWDVATQRNIANLEDKFGAPSVAFSPNGAVLVSAGLDTTVKLWDVATGTPIATFPHPSDVSSVAFSPNGSVLASGTRDGTIELWDMSSYLTLLTSSELLTADVNGDGVVDIQDLVFVASRLGQAGENPADVNGDGVVDIQDLVFVAGELGGVAAAPSAWHHTSFGVPTRARVEQWLLEARRLPLTDARSQRGVLLLERLLAALVPKETALLHNYPNPFNPETWIPYHLAEPAHVVLTLYSVDGKAVRRLDLGHQAAGYYQSKSRAAYWDGRNAVGERVASGLYFYTLTAGDFAATRKMLIMK